MKLRLLTIAVVLLFCHTEAAADQVRVLKADTAFTAEAALAALQQPLEHPTTLSAGQTYWVLIIGGQRRGV